MCFVRVLKRCLDSIQHIRDPRPLAMLAYTALGQDTECLVHTKAMVQSVYTISKCLQACVPAADAEQQECLV